MHALLKNGLIVAGLVIATHATAQITFFENDGYQGRSFSTEKQVRNFQRYGFNDLASSAEVLRGRWEVCDNAGFGGRCVILRPGRYPSLSAMGMNDRISSVRMVSRYARVDDNRYAPAPIVAAPAGDYGYRRRDNEQLHEASVTSVRAVVGPPEQRCWVEREQVQERHSNAPATIAGAVVGAILGHQVGRGSGRDLATVGGAVAGGVVGANLGRDRQVSTQDVQHCSTVPNQARPEFWDVTYTFRGQEHRVQMSTPPGATVTVNDKGEPRQ